MSCDDPRDRDSCAGQLESGRAGYHRSMKTAHDDPGRGARRGPRLAAPLAAIAVLTLASLPPLVLPLAAGCGDDGPGAASVTPDAQLSRSAGSPAPPSVTADGEAGPPKSIGGVCERTTADRKSLPSWARITVERFVAAVDAGDRAAMRALFDPAGAAEALADLRPVARLGLLALEDRY